MRCVRGIGVVFTPPVTNKGIVMKKSLLSHLDAYHHLSDDCHHDEDELDEAVEGYRLSPIPSIFSTRNQFWLDDRVHVVAASNVVGVLGEVAR